MRLAEEELWFTVIPSSTKSEGLPCYDFHEKDAKCCRYCGSHELNSAEEKTHTLFGIVNDHPAECVLHRKHYKCRECGKGFFQSASDNDLHKETFTTEFVRYALEDWVNNKEKTLTLITQEYFISMPTIEKWEKTLVQYFDEHFHAETQESIVFSSFLDRNHFRRGIVYTFDSEGNSYISAFLPDYSIHTIKRYINALDSENKSHVRHVMFRFIPDLIEIIRSSFMFAESICINTDSLYTMLCKEFANLPEEEETDIRNRLNSAISLKPKTIDERAKKKKVLSLWLAEVEKKTNEDLSRYRVLFGDEYALIADRAKFPTIPNAIKDYPSRIKELINLKASYEAIALKLYDNEEIKKQIIDAIQATAHQHGADAMGLWNTAMFVLPVKHESTDSRTEKHFVMPDIRGYSYKIS